MNIVSYEASHYESFSSPSFTYPSQALFPPSYQFVWLTELDAGDAPSFTVVLQVTLRIFRYH